jgi:hypothetical protein
MMHGSLGSSQPSTTIDVPDVGLPEPPDVGLPEPPDVGLPEPPDVGVPEPPDFEPPDFPNTPGFEPPDIPDVPDFGNAPDLGNGLPDVPDFVGGTPDFDYPDVPDFGIPDVPDVGDGTGWWPDTGMDFPNFDLPTAPDEGPWFPGLDSGFGGMADWFENSVDWGIGGTGDFLGDTFTEMWSVMGSALGGFFDGTGAPGFAEGAMTKSMILFGGIAIVAIAAYVVM